MANISDYQGAFDKAIKDKGGRFNTEELDIESQILFDEFKDSCQKMLDDYRKQFVGNEEKLPYIHFDYINNPTFNASAIVNDDNMWFIGFNYGTVLLLLDVFNRMMSRQDILTNIGNPDEETNPEPIPYLTVNYQVIQDLYETDSAEPVIVPINPERSNHAALLTNFALIFLFYHEWGHLNHGHVLYKRNTTGKSFISEFDSTIDSEGIDHLTNKVLEWDADSFAATQSVYRLQQLILKFESFPEIELKYKTKSEGVFSNLLFVTWVMFRLMGVVRNSFSESANKNYPSPEIRIRNAIYYFVNTLQDGLLRFGYGHETFTHSLSETVRSAESALSLISKVDFQQFDLKLVVSLIKETESVDSTDFMSEYKKHFIDVVKPALLKLIIVNDLRY